MRVLVLGATGMLGTDVLDEWRKAPPGPASAPDELIPAGSSEADLRDAGQVDLLIAKARPDWVIVSAAYTDVDGCETNRELAFAVNATGVENVAHSSEKI